MFCLWGLELGVTCGGHHKPLTPSHRQHQGWARPGPTGAFRPTTVRAQASLGTEPWGCSVPVLAVLLPEPGGRPLQTACLLVPTPPAGRVGGQPHRAALPHLGCL